MDHQRSLKTSRPSTGHARAMIALVIGLSSMCGWLFWFRDSSLAIAPVATANEVRTTSPTHVVRPHVVRPEEQAFDTVARQEIAPPTLDRLPSAAVPPAAAASSNQDLIAGPRDENLVPGAKPHPVTSEHLALYHEVNLVEATWTALERRDFAKARELIEERRLGYAGRNDDLDRGMSLLADCMQYPSAATLQLAQHFYDDETYSTARRRIRRWCLER